MASPRSSSGDEMMDVLIFVLGLLAALAALGWLAAHWQDVAAWVTALPDMVRSARTT